MSNIWIITHNAPPPEYDVRIRNKAMAKYLTKMGHTVTIFGASTIHNTNINLINDKRKFIVNNYDNVRFVHVKAPSYSGNGFKRIYNLIKYPSNLWKIVKNFERPDVIINDLEIFAFNYPFKIAKKMKAPIISEIRDLMPESLIEYGFLRRNSLLAKFLFSKEKNIYLKSDKIVFSMEGGKKYLEDHNILHLIDEKKISFINNGVDLERFNENRINFSIDDRDLFDKKSFKVVYTGSIRKVNNLGLLLDIAKEINNPCIKILVWGDGDELESLKERIAKEKINNVFFKGKVKKEYVPFILSKADLAFAHNNPSKLFKYGISFNKVFDYLASGKPVLCDFPCDFNPVLRFNAGVGVSDPCAKNIALIIERFANMGKEEYDEYCKNAIIASQYYDYKNLTKLLNELIKEVLENEE